MFPPVTELSWWIVGEAHMLVRIGLSVARRCRTCPGQPGLVGRVLLPRWHRAARRADAAAHLLSMEGAVRSEESAWSSPGADKLCTATGSRFMAVRLASVRAKELVDYTRGVYRRGAVPPLVVEGAKPLTTAMCELADRHIVLAPADTKDAGQSPGEEPPAVLPA